MKNLYRIRLALGNDTNSYTESTNKKDKIRMWHKNIEKHYKYNVKVIQRLEKNGWHDWRLIEDF